MNIVLKLSSIAALVVGVTASQIHVQACTDFRLTAKDGTVIITRSLEFAPDMQSTIMSSPREKTFNSAGPNGKPGLTWKSKYGYLYVDGFHMGVPVDGINEKGLSFEALYLPGLAQYQTVPAGQENYAVGYTQLGDWILGNFQTPDEVKQALQKIFVFANPTLLGGKTVVFPLHFAIYDSTGKGIVVEYIKGKLHIYDNKIGVMTNSPSYAWQLTNLRNYANLSAYSPKPIVMDGMTYSATGEGAGMAGLPGDISPPSRFVKTTFLTQTALPTNNAADTLNLAQHIINTVDIPLGFVRNQVGAPGPFEKTQWIVFKDLTHRVLYFRSYDNLTLRSIDLNKVNFAPNAPVITMPIASPVVIPDVTQQFVESGVHKQ